MRLWKDPERDLSNAAALVVCARPLFPEITGSGVRPRACVILKYIARFDLILVYKTVIIFRTRLVHGMVHL